MSEFKTMINKLRAFHKGRMIYEEWHNRENVKGYFEEIVNKITNIDDDTFIIFYFSHENGIQWHNSEILDGKTMCFTNLYDKNGKEIYEGDIIKFVGEDFEYVYVVKYETTDKYVGFMPFCGGNNDCCNCDPEADYTKSEVIGNIYENPELLEVKE